MSTKDLLPSWRGDLPWQDRAAALTARFPTQPGFAELDKRMTNEPGHSYHLSPSVESALDDRSPEDRQAFLYAFLLWQMAQFGPRLAASNLPAEFALHYADAFHRMMDAIEDRSLASDLHRDIFVKDLALTRLVLIPAVGQVIYLHAGVPLRWLPRWGLKGLLYIFGRCGGPRPFIEIHTHDTMVAEFFNYDGWEEAYRLSALLLIAFPRFHGMCGYSWMVDPAIPKISPRLAYLHDRPVLLGAAILPMDSDPDSIRLSTGKSPTRREAYEAGTYTPRRHALIWSRKDLIRAYYP